jgi:hypothetical protein
LSIKTSNFQPFFGKNRIFKSFFGNSKMDKKNVQNRKPKILFGKNKQKSGCDENALITKKIILKI